MSVLNVKRAIGSFLSSPEPEVLCIRGNWGTGKTHTWKEEAKRARGSAATLALNNYSYVSLFGVNSIEDIKSQILQNLQTRKQVGDVPDYSTLENMVSAGTSGLQKAITEAARVLPHGLKGGVISALSSVVSKHIVCIDDMERKGAGLTAGDVLGYVSYLKEERKCKIVLLLNDEALRGPDRDQFSSYLEKVVDKNVLFAPTPTESVFIAIEDDDEVATYTKDRCVSLGIDNVRVIRKLYSAVQAISPLLASYHHDVMRSVVSSIVLLGWCHHQPEVAPSIDFVQRRSLITDRLSRAEKGEANDKELIWDQLIDNYGFSHIDEFDETIKESIAKGYFVDADIKKHATALHERVESSYATKEYRKAWDLFHNSFKASADTVAVAVSNAFVSGVKHLTADNLSNTVSLLKLLSADEKVKPVIDAFLEAHKNVPGRLKIDPMFRDANNPVDHEVAAALNAAIAEALPKLSADELFTRSADEGLTQPVLSGLAALPIEEYVRVFKSYELDDLQKILIGVMQYRAHGNGNPDMASITQKTDAALKQIARESPINEHRVRARKVLLDD
ncbi:hypothetical protein [Agrobacterium sp. MS2]|uniref:hypothetical protein n=1 Tax=Agrobacterium sp. MS2 TaxID=1345498 RepID=UPI000DBFB096|nr:hypothetical protein [Agrobacterium sp. MS2]RAL98712.1 hypothetical protein DOU54_06545 [Agrobacterium sp. MS2]